jgi:DnaJ-domain-containing protein 1
MAQKRDTTPTESEQRRKLDWLRSELQKPAVMNNPRRRALLEAALAEGQALLRSQRGRGK